MNTSPSGSLPARLYRHLCSTQTAIALFLGICVAAIPGTFGESRTSYSSPFFVALLILLGVCTAACTLRNRKRISPSAHVVHLGVLVLLAGAALSSRGSVATVNVYEGSTVSTAYRWDLNADVPLGVDLAVKRINMAYYPVPIKIGVLRGGEKYALLTVASGQSFDLGEYSVRVVGFDPQNLRLAVSRNGALVGYTDTTGAHPVSVDFPYEFRLVAFKDPVVERMWVDLELSRNSQPVAQGISEVNSPFHWEGVNYFHVQTSRDRFGRAYAGIQIVRDPGTPVVFAGLAIVVLGTILTFVKSFLKWSGTRS